MAVCWGGFTLYLVDAGRMFVRFGFWQLFALMSGSEYFFFRVLFVHFVLGPMCGKLLIRRLWSRAALMWFSVLFRFSQPICCQFAFALLAEGIG